MGHQRSVADNRLACKDQGFKYSFKLLQANVQEYGKVTTRSGTSYLSCVTRSGKCDEGFRYGFQLVRVIFVSHINHIECSL